MFLQDFKSATSKLTRYKGIITMDLDLSVGEISAFINQIIEKMKITDSIWLFTKGYAKSKLEIATVTGPEVSIKNYIPYSL